MKILIMILIGINTPCNIIFASLNGIPQKNDIPFAILFVIIFFLYIIFIKIIGFFKKNKK